MGEMNLQKKHPLRAFAEFLEIPLARVVYEAEVFLWDMVKPLYDHGFALGARAPGRGTEMFPSLAAGLGTNDQVDLAIYAYAWSLRRCAVGCSLVSVYVPAGTECHLRPDRDLTLIRLVHRSRS